MASTREPAFEWAMSWMMISESDVVWKKAPARSRVVRKLPRLTRLPLWAMAMRPLVESTLIGWALSQCRIARGRVTRMANGHVAGELGKDVVGEDFQRPGPCL